MDFVLIMKLVQCIHNFFNGNLKVYNSLSQNIKEEFFLKKNVIPHYKPQKL
jgi:hypothetical protein